MNKRCRIDDQSGSSLLEVLISLFVLAVGMLGVLSMQAESMKFNTQSNHMSQAIFLANDLAERMRANRANANSYVTGTNAIEPLTSASTACNDGTCTDATGAASIYEFDMANWRYELGQRLPEGKAFVFSRFPNYEIVIHFASTTEGMWYEDAIIGETKDWNKSFSLVVRI